MNTEEKEYLTTEEVAKIFGKTDRTVRNWAIKGYIQAIKIGSEWFFPKDTYIRTNDRDVKCASCSNVINSANDFKDNVSRKEFGISGMCQSCQDKTFK